MLRARNDLKTKNNSSLDVLINVIALCCVSNYFQLEIQNQLKRLLRA